MTLRHVLLGILACLALLIGETYFWTWKTSGSLQATAQWGKFPWGYSAVAHLPRLGEWPLQKENLTYIEHHQAFLGVRDQYVRRGEGFEHLRTLYAYLTQGLWFVGPIFSGIVLNVVLWGLACLSAAYVARSLLPQQPWAPWVAALLGLSGQGFIASVGEISPHVLGYGIGFWLAAYVCAKRLWGADSRPSDHLVAHGFLGVLKLGYEAAWLSYPFLILISYAASAQRSHRLFSMQTAVFLAGCSLLSLGPGALMIFLSMPFGASDSVTVMVRALRSGVHIDGSLVGHPLAGLLTTYFEALADGILAFGPFVLALLTAGVFAIIRQRDRFDLALLGMTVATLAAVAVVLIPSHARGYTTFALALPMFIIAVHGYSWIWRGRPGLRYAAPSLLAGCIAWSNAPLLGFKLPLFGFSWGFIHTLQNGHWQAFDIIQLR